VGVSYGSVLNILREHLDLAMSVPDGSNFFLTPIQKSFRVETCSELLAIYSAAPDNVLSRIITVDEMWIHHWDPDTKQELMQWKQFETRKLLRSSGSCFTLVLILYQRKNAVRSVWTWQINPTLFNVWSATRVSPRTDPFPPIHGGSHTVD